MGRCRRLGVLGAVVLVSGCATLPLGPSVMVLPGPGKPFEQFEVEDAACRQWATQRVGSPTPSAPPSTAVGAVAGMAVGAAMGAALGSASGHAGTGAAIGAGAGLLGGSAIGASADQAIDGTAQRRYDMAYQQCMYAKGNHIPAAAGRSWTGVPSQRSSMTPAWPAPPGPVVLPPPPPTGVTP
jgi:hypothetical protein